MNIFHHIPMLIPLLSPLLAANRPPTSMDRPSLNIHENRHRSDISHRIHGHEMDFSVYTLCKLT